MRLVVSSAFQGRDLAILKSVITYLVSETQWIYSDTEAHDVYFSNRVSEQSSASKQTSEYFVSLKQQNKNIPLGSQIDPKSLRSLFYNLNSDLESYKKHETKEDLASFLLSTVNSDTPAVIKISLNDYHFLIDQINDTVVSTQPLSILMLNELINNKNTKFRKIRSFDKHFKSKNLTFKNKITVRHFLWQLGYQCEDKFLLQKQYPSDVMFYLTEWPDFGKYNHKPDFVYFSAHLKKQADNYSGICLVNQSTETEVNSFLNATLLSGYVSTTKSPTSFDYKKTSLNKGSSFLAKLKKTIFGLQN